MITMQSKVWIWDFSALVGSLMSFTGLVVLLAVFDGRPVFEWNGVTLNTVVAILSVALKVFLVFAVGECIGQWKWIAFSRGKRELMDFERIDLASRGPLGSLNLLWRKQTPWILRLGIAVMVLAIAIEPFSQQLVHLEDGTEWVDELDEIQAMNLRAAIYTHGTLYEVNSNVGDAQDDPDSEVSYYETIIDLSMEASILNALSGNASNSSLQQQAGMQCPTGNCTWDSFESLGVCSKCADLSSDLRRVDNIGEYMGFINTDLTGSDYTDFVQRENATAYALPNGHFIPNINDCKVANAFDRPECEFFGLREFGFGVAYMFPATTFGTGNRNLTNSMSDLDTLIWSMSVIHMDIPEIERRLEEDLELSDEMLWPDTPLRAEECALYYCVKTIKTDISGSEVQESVRTATEFVREPESWKTTIEGLAEELDPDEVPEDLDSLDFDGNRTLQMTPLQLHNPANDSIPPFMITQDSVASISSFFQSHFRDEKFTNREWMETLPDELGDDPVGFNGAWANERFIPEHIGGIWTNDPSRTIPTVFDKVSTSMTNDMRRNSGNFIHQSEFTYERDYNEMIGMIGTPTTVYRSEWYWIALHGVVFLGGVAFCAATMLISARDAKNIPTWKSSALAAMSQVQDTTEILKGAATIEEMEKRARKSAWEIPAYEFDVGEKGSGVDESDPALSRSESPAYNIRKLEGTYEYSAVQGQNMGGR